MKRNSPLKKTGLKKKPYVFTFGDNTTLGLKKKPIRGAYKALKKQSAKHIEGKEERIVDGLKMMELFNLHWDTHPDKKCEVCGTQLWGENLTLYHDHALEKSKYPEFALNLECLILVCSICHTMRHSGYAFTSHLKEIERIKNILL